jgi:hypothetical protein
MRLSVKSINMRGGYREAEWESEVIDEETGDIVGWVRSETSPAWRRIWLLGGKYQADFSSTNSRLECEAFAKGVEAVLNHMVDMREESSLVAGAPT